jgi:hydrophobic/amphiphilic exporter-1 (mainly G- bacteria), HAE1 family
MIASMLVSSFMALSLTPALCANLLKPTGTTPRERDARRGLRGIAARGATKFADGFDGASQGYRWLTTRTVRRIGPVLAVYVVLVGVCGLMYWRMPGGFLPTEDQGQLQVMIQLPAGSTQARTLAVLKRVEQILHRHSAVANVTGLIGWSFQGTGQNVGMAFVELKDWDKRKVSAMELQDQLNDEFSTILDGRVDAQLPPSVPGVGHSEGFVFRLEDRGGVGLDALKAAREALFAKAKVDPALTDVHSEDLPDAPRIELTIDRAKAYAMGVSFDKISDLLGSTFGSTYVDDFPAGGLMRRVVVEGDASARMTDDQLMALQVENTSGTMVPLSAIASSKWTIGPVALSRYNGYPSLDVSGRAARGYSSGAAMAEMEHLAIATLPVGVAYDWVDAAREETVAEKQTPLLIGLSLLAVFMALAALYESWTIPLAVLMVVPLGVIGAVAAVLMRGMPNDVYFKVGMITVIGLSAKNAILIVQFARDLYARGATLNRAVIDAAGARFRPIVMTSAAFLLGVAPLVMSSGAGAESRRSIGTGVFGGVLAATLLGLVFAPVAFYAVAALTRGRRRAAAAPAPAAHHGGEPGDGPAGQALEDREVESR